MVNFRFPTVRDMLISQGNTVVSDFDIKDTLNAYPKWENQDIVDDLIERYKAGELIDSDIGNLYEDQLKDKLELQGMSPHYIEAEKEFNERWRIQEKLEKELKKKDPQAYAKFKKEEIEKYRRQQEIEVVQWHQNMIMGM